jgi:hypothetical protein
MSDPIESYRGVEIKSYESLERFESGNRFCIRYFCFVATCGKILSDDTVAGLKIQIDEVLKSASSPQE